MPRLLVTGIGGMIGAVIAKYALTKGFEVIGVDDFREGNESNCKEFRVYPYDITNLPAMDSVFHDEKPDLVLHCAAEAAEALSPFIRSFTYNTNIVGTANIINCCINHNIKKIISFSSIARFGDGNPPFKEHDQVRLLEPYAISKYCNELDLSAAFSQFSLNYNVITAFNVCSPFQNFYSKYRNALAIFIRQSISKDPKITIYGNGQQVRSFSDAKYICRPILRLFNDTTNFKGENFNLGSEQPISILEAAKLVQTEANKRGFRPEIIHLEQRKEVKIAYCDTSKARRLLDFEDNTDLPSLISEMFDAALSQPVREIKKRKYEIEKEMYSYWK